MTRKQAHQLARSGAFEELYEAHRTLVLGHCWLLTRDLEDAQDLSQEVWLIVHKHLASFKGLSSFGTWLYRITLNRHIMNQRRHTPPLVGLDLVENLPGNDTISSALMLDLKQAMRGLSPIQLRALLGALMGRSQRSYGRNRVVVASWLHQARVKLRRGMGR